MDDATWEDLEDLYAQALEVQENGVELVGGEIDPEPTDDELVSVFADGSIEDEAAPQFVSAGTDGPGAALCVNTNQPTVVDVQSDDLQRVLSAYAYQFSHSQIYFVPRLGGPLAGVRPHAILQQANAQARAVAWNQFQQAIPSIVAGLRDKVTGNITVSMVGGEMWVGYQSNGYTISMGFGANPGQFGLRGSVRINRSVYYRLYVTNGDRLVMNQSYNASADLENALTGLPGLLLADCLTQLIP